LWGAAEVLYEAIGITLARVQRHHYGPYIEAARAQVEEAAWEEAWAEGRAMALEEAVEYALTTEEEQSSSVRATAPEEPPAPLTRREREVAVLVGRGLTNRRIAEELSISEHTAITHVRNILKKLEIHSRAEITARLAEQGHL
jgi:non-specific serine/threonine protein kinase